MAGVEAKTATEEATAPRELLKSSQFRQERQRSWRELEKLLDEVKRRGIRSLSHEQLTRLPMLYRGAISSLSVVTLSYRSRTFGD